jgi:spore maturation protein CgeB
MKIAIIGKFYTEGFGLHIEESLINLGHSVLCIDPEGKFLQFDFLSKRVKNINKTLYQNIFFKIPTIRNIKSKEIYAKFKREKVDLTIVLHDFLTSEEVKNIKRITKSSVVMWFPDAISNFQKSMFFTAKYDWLFFSDKYIVHKLKAEFGLNTYYLPQCFSIFKHKRVMLSENERIFYECEVTNAGNLYPSRAALYKELSKYHIKMWGMPPAIWLKEPDLDGIVMNKEVYNAEKSKAFSAAKIVLNNLHPAVIDGVNKRTFEIPACGGFQISSYREATNELLEVDKEIVCYHNLDDLKDKIDYYLEPSNDEKRNNIIEAGWKRVNKEHTYQHRMKEIFSIVFK